jgi:hypothetical protein
MNGDRLAQLIQLQRDLQVRLGNDFADWTHGERISYIRVQTLAAIAELMEALDETSWKTWSTAEHVNDDAMFGELRDTWQFVTNLMFAAYPDADGAEIADKLETDLHAKWGVNYRRAEAGYDGKNKCPGCGRALDDIHTLCVSSTKEGDKSFYCVKMGWREVK